MALFLYQRLRESRTAPHYISPHHLFSLAVETEPRTLATTSTAATTAERLTTVGKTTLRSERRARRARCLKRVQEEAAATRMPHSCFDRMIKVYASPGFGQITGLALLLLGVCYLVFPDGSLTKSMALKSRTQHLSTFAEQQLPFSRFGL